MRMERVELRPETDLRDVVDRMGEDKIPRIIERNGDPRAVVVSPEQFEGAHEPTSRRLKDELLSLAGVWSDLDADRMIECVHHRAIHPSVEQLVGRQHHAPLRIARSIAARE